MKKQLLFVLSTLLTLSMYAQINYDKGYIIDTSNQRTECFIKNMDWSNNPSEIEYKTSETANTTIAGINNIQEFGIYNQSKYLKATVDIDLSSDNIMNLSDDRMPEFSEKEVFLKVLIEGKGSLYSYKDGNLKRFFFKTEGSEIEQLIYKRYNARYNKVRKNNRYQQQLLNKLPCPKFTADKVQNLRYATKELINFFEDYNNCYDSESKNFEKKKKNDLFNLSIRPGINSSTLSIENSVFDSDNVDFDNEITFRFGIEAEFILPFNQNKWSVIFEPTYQYFESEKILSDQTVKAEYNSIEFPIGIRHYLFLSEKSKLFLNGAFVVDASSNTVIDFEARPDLEIDSRSNLAFGIGYKYNDRFGLEFRYQTPRNIVSKYVSWDSDYSTISFIIGYSIF